MAWRRLLSCIKQWPECSSGEYNPSCCRFPKSCSCMADDENTPSFMLEPVRAEPIREQTDIVSSVTVEDLIAKLAELPPDMPVYYMVDGLGPTRPDWVEVVTDPEKAFLIEGGDVVQRPPYALIW